MTRSRAAAMAASALLFCAPPEAARAQDASLPPTIVTGERPPAPLPYAPGPVRGYRALDTTSGTRTPTPIAETPAIINVAPRALIDDTGSLRAEDVLRYLPGVIGGQGFAGSVDQFQVRGFETLRVLRNGLPLDGDLLATGRRDLANIERIEVLKGPSAVLFGRSDPGGAINFITRQPQDARAAYVSQGFGSFGLFRTEFDATGAVPFGTGNAVRISGAYETARSFRDVVTSDRRFIAPSLRAQLGPDTTLLVELEHLRRSITLDWGIPALGGRPVALPRRRYLGEPFARDTSENTLAGAVISHRVNTDLTLNARLYGTAGSTSFDSFFPLGLEPDGRTLTRFQSADRNRLSSSIYGTVEAVQEFRTGPVQHRLLAGADLLVTNGLGRNFVGQTLPVIDIFQPVYGADIATYGPQRRTEIDNQWWGLFVQDQMRLPYDIFVTAGVRLDQARARSRLTVEGETTGSSANDLQASPRIGVLWQATPGLAVFANYVAGLGAPNAATTRTGETLQPERGTQVEAGLRLGLLENRLAATLAAFQVTRRNIQTFDPFDPGFVVATGEARNRGAELELLANLGSGLNAIAAYTYIDSKITQDNNPDLIGNRFRNVPRHAASLFVTKTFAEGTLAGLTLGGGVISRSSSQADIENTVRLPPFTTFDLMARYRFQIERTPMLAQLNIRNLFDKTYYPNAAATNGITVGEPFSVLGTVRVEF